MNDPRVNAETNGIAVDGNTGDGSVTGSGTVFSGIRRGQVSEGHGNQQVTVEVKNHDVDTKPLDTTTTGIAVRLQSLEEQLEKSSDEQTRWQDKLEAKINAIMTQQTALVQAEAVRQALKTGENDRLARLEGDVEKITHSYFGNGGLGTARWELITRTMMILIVIVVIFLILIAALQAVQMSQVQQQITLIMEMLR